MTFPVRLFGYQGLARIPVTQDGGVIGTDSVYVYHQPYLWSQLQTSSGLTSVAFTVAGVPANHTVDITRFVQVEVPDGQAVRYEISFSGTATNATTTSPRLTGQQNLMYGPGAILSFIDASGT